MDWGVGMAVLAVVVEIEVKEVNVDGRCRTLTQAKRTITSIHCIHQPTNEPEIHLTLSNCIGHTE